MNTPSVLVIGGGLAGLFTALHLRRAGLTVTLLEATSALGGRASTDNHHGFLLNRGAHALYKRGEAAHTLHTMGIALDGVLPPSQGLTYAWEDQLYPLPNTVLSVLRATRLTRTERWQLLCLFSAFLRGNTHAPGSYAAWVEERRLSPQIHAVAHVIARLTTYANAPEALHAGATLAQIASALRHNVLYLHGGWQSLIDALAEHARAQGVHIRTHTRVTRLTHHARGGFEIHTDKQRCTAERVVVALPARAAAKLIGTLSPQLVAEVQHAIPVFAASLDLALAHLPRDTPRFALGLDTPTYVSTHAPGARLAPKGGAVLHAMWYHATHSALPHNAIRERLERLVDHLQPGWRDHLVHARFLPRMEVCGALMHAEHGRPSPVLSDCPGLYVAGDWCGDRGMLADAAAASARLVAQHIASSSEALYTRIAS